VSDVGDHLAPEAPDDSSTTPRPDFLIRMGLVAGNPCDAVERPRAVQSVARGYGADEVRRLIAVVHDTIAGRRDRAILLTLVLTGGRRVEVIDLRRRRMRRGYAARDDIYAICLNAEDAFGIFFVSNHYIGVVQHLRNDRLR
jgi:integrase